MPESMQTAGVYFDDSARPNVGDEVEILDGTLTGHHAIVDAISEAPQLHWVTLNQTKQKVVLIGRTLLVLRRATE